MKYQCVSCIYFTACGSTTRTVLCKGRTTKTQKRKEKNNVDNVKGLEGADRSKRHIV